MKSSDNPHIGTIWIYSDELKQTKKWIKEVPLPDGWNYGRIINWDKRIEYLKKQLEKQEEMKVKVNQLTNMYHDYIEFGILYIREKYDYNKSEENLTRAFKRYVKEYNTNTLRLASMKRHYNQSYTHLSIDERIKYFSDMYDYVQVHGYSCAAKKFDWHGTWNTLRWNFRRYLNHHIQSKNNDV